MKTTAFVLAMLLSAGVSAQQRPTTGYAPVNGLKMYYEVHGSGDPVVLLHGSYMTITNNWTEWIGELSKTRKVIAVEMQGHGRTADIKRDFSYENLADDVAALLDHLKIPNADLIGYSMGGGVAMQCAIRHPEKVRKVVSISAVFRHDGWVKEALDAFPQFTAEAFKGSPIETEYKRLSPTPDEFPSFVKRVIAMDLKPYDFGADKLKATKAPMFFIHGDADGVRLEHISEMFRLKGGEIFGDMRPRSASRLAILPDTTHVTLMERMSVIVPMVNDFFDAKPQSKAVTGGAGGERPNVVVVVVDDLRFDELHAGGHPYLETPNMDRLAAEGALFVNSFHAVPLCSPNRATLLTGQFPSRHGIIDNIARNLASHHLETFNLPMKTAGYRAAFLGKWHMGNDPTPRPGWDYWVAMPGQGRMTDPELFEDGVLHKVPGYMSDLLTDRAVSFIQREHGLPFLLYLAHKAVHPDVVQRDDGSVDPESDRGYIPAARHEGRYRDRVFTRRQLPSEIAADLAGKPAIRHALAKLPMAAGPGPGEHEHAAYPWTGEETIRRRAEMILAVDESLGRIIATLDSLKLLDKTVIILSSDNGFFFGEHGLTTERRLPYEESIRNPLLMRYPPRIPAGARPEGLALTVDLAPTVLDLAGVPISPSIQGRSLVPLFQGTPAGWRQAVLVELYSNEQPFPHLMDMDYRAIRTGRYKYIHWIKHPDQDELYDLKSDPLERRNLASDPALAPVKTSLRADLGKLVLEAVGLPAR